MKIKRILLTVLLFCSVMMIGSCSNKASTSDGSETSETIGEETADGYDDSGDTSAANEEAPEITYPVKPFDGKDISRINVRCKYDLYDPAELSAEDTETLVDMLERVELAAEKMDVRELIPYSGNSPASFTLFFGDGEKLNFSAESGIVYPDHKTEGGAYIINGDYYAVDRETVSEISDFYHDVLLDRYFPEYGASYPQRDNIAESAESKPADSSAGEFVPFVETRAAEYSYIELGFSGIDGYRDDGTPIEIARLSEEDAETVFDLLKQIRIDSPPLNKYTWREAPTGDTARYSMSAVPSVRIRMMSAG